MCGFVVSAYPNKISQCFTGVGIDTLARGPDLLQARKLKVGSLQLFVEFAHLFITKPAASQPLETNEWLLVINGEIYNYHELAVDAGCDTSALNDSEVFFQHLLHFGLESTLNRSLGMYAGLLINKRTGICQGFTDQAGKKPLLLWNSENGWHVGTGIESNYFTDETTSLQVLRPGLHHICFESGMVKAVENINLTLRNTKTSDIRDILRAAVALRAPEGQPFAVALSGGLDSSIITYILETELKLTPDYYVVGEELSEEVNSLIRLLAIDKSRVRLIKPSCSGEILQLIRDVCKIVKSYNPSVVSNGIATMLLSRAIHNDGLRVLLGGEGADEFFCGYQAMYSGHHDPEQLRSRLIADLHFTELRRLDLICSHHATEARCPFLDQRVIQHALSMEAVHHCCSERKIGKIQLREHFRGLLPDNIINAPKEPFDITSGLQRQVIEAVKNYGGKERDALKVVFEGVLGKREIYKHDYFSAYPAFDSMIDTRYRKYKTK
ncbi:asparagine synthase-related protein [Spongorhabdus nitratireducens]